MSDNVRTDRVHGDVSDLWIGLNAIGMPASRQPDAVAAVRRVLEANGATGVTWYKPAATNDLCFRWRGREHNAMWCGAIRITAQTDLVFPLTVTAREVTTGQPVHHFPGVTPRPGGSRASAEPRPVLCQECFSQHPEGGECV